MSTADIFKRRLRQAVKESTFTVAEYAQDNHRFKSRTGQLERAVNTRMLNDLSGEVFIDNGIAAYAGFVHNGSAPHRIVPNGKKALRWVKNGAFQFARSVNHPGYKGDPFLYTAVDDKKREVLNTFDRYAELAKEDIATELVKR